MMWAKRWANGMGHDVGVCMGKRGLYRHMLMHIWIPVCELGRGIYLWPRGGRGIWPPYVSVPLLMSSIAFKTCTNTLSMD